LRREFGAVERATRDARPIWYTTAGRGRAGVWPRLGERRHRRADAAGL